MDHVLRAAEILHRAEASLRESMAKAAAEGDYSGVVQITSWARAIRDLLEKKQLARAGAPELPDSNGDATPTAGVKNGRARQVRPTDDYPRFFRKGDELVRVAWSRRARSEYQHKTTQTVLRSVTDMLSRLGGKGRVFSTDDLLPLHDPEGTEVPAYQAYVCIALLKTTGLIQQHGRQGYSITSPEDFAHAVEAIWRKLPGSK